MNSLKTFAIFALTLLISCSPSTKLELDSIAENYVKLVLSVGQYDDGYVDSYYGPEEWKTEIESTEQDSVLPYDRLRIDAQNLLTQVNAVSQKSSSQMDSLRILFLQKQLEAIVARLDILNGKQFTFAEEAKALYDVDVPTYDEKYFEEILYKLEKLVPGRGDLGKRMNKLREKFNVPSAKIDTLFKTAVNECQTRTKKQMTLPDGEQFTISLERDKPWGAYNWYKGNAFSLIELNIDRPLQSNSFIRLAAHEGYPGHHVQMALMEENLVTKKGWVEYSVYPLYSPESLIAEGIATYNSSLLFSPQERLEYEKNVMCKLAGIDTTGLTQFVEIQKASRELSKARIEAARRYLDGQITRTEAAKWIQKYNLTTPERAEASLRFIDYYRSYIVNYYLGYDLVKKFVEPNDTLSNEEKWEKFVLLFEHPFIMKLN